MGCSLDEKYDNMSDMQNCDNYLWVVHGTARQRSPDSMQCAQIDNEGDLEE